MKIQHRIADVSVRPAAKVSRRKLRKAISSALDELAYEDSVDATVVDLMLQEHHGEYYLTPGYLLRVYRHRADLTQAQLAARVAMKQHHISEMENNKRPIGKAAARKFGKLLEFDYRRLL